MVIHLSLDHVPVANYSWCRHIELYRPAAARTTAGIRLNRHLSDPHPWLGRGRRRQTDVEAIEAGRKAAKCLSLLNRHRSSCGDAQAALRGNRDRRQVAAVFQPAREGDDTVGSADASEKAIPPATIVWRPPDFDYLLTCARSTWAMPGSAAIETGPIRG
jgi:hypothetical protein